MPRRGCITISGSNIDGVFKSWAVTRGPSLDPHDKRLAVETEDHPLDYGDFEGTIPKDQYGGGTVQLWDRGYWESDDPEGGFKKGDLKFKLDGEKLHGSWVLVRMRHDRNGGKRTNWLLIKHRDEYAREGEANDVLEEDRSVASGRTIEQIAEGKGKAPKPFMMAQERPRQGRRGLALQSRRGGGGARQGRTASRQRQGAGQTRGGQADRQPFRPSSRRSFAPPSTRRRAARAGATRSSSTAIACSCASRTARSRSRPARGSTGPRSFRRSQRKRRRCRMCLIDGEIVALDHKGVPEFLGAAGGARRTARPTS